jgi:hypothetical protein
VRPPTAQPSASHPCHHPSPTRRAAPPLRSPARSLVDGHPRRSLRLPSPRCHTHASRVPGLFAFLQRRYPQVVSPVEAKRRGGGGGSPEQPVDNLYVGEQHQPQGAARDSHAAWRVCGLRCQAGAAAAAAAAQPHAPFANGGTSSKRTGAPPWTPRSVLLVPGSTRHNTHLALLPLLLPCAAPHPLPHASTQHTVRHEPHHPLLLSRACGQGPAPHQHGRDVCRNGRLPGAPAQPAGATVCVCVAACVCVCVCVCVHVAACVMEGRGGLLGAAARPPGATVRVERQGGGA